MQALHLSDIGARPARVAGALHNLARVAWADGDLDRARDLIDEALALRADLTLDHPDRFRIEASALRFAATVEGIDVSAAFLDLLERVDAKTGATHVDALRARIQAVQSMVALGFYDVALAIVDSQGWAWGRSMSLGPSLRLAMADAERALAAVSRFERGHRPPHLPAATAAAGCDAGEVPESY